MASSSPVVAHRGLLTSYSDETYLRQILTVGAGFKATLAFIPDIFSWSLYLSLIPQRREETVEEDLDEPLTQKQISLVQETWELEGDLDKSRNRFLL